MLLSGLRRTESGRDTAQEEDPRDRGSMILIVRSAVFNVVFYATFIALMIVGLPCLLLPRPMILSFVRLWARVSVFLLRAICGTKVTFKNLHLLPKGASILAVKHQSFLETFALATVLDDFSYVMKRELMSIPFFGWYVKATGQIGIDRDRKAGIVAVLQQAVCEKLKAGYQVVIFPEGTRRPVGAPALYKSGVSALCLHGKVPCTPVALNSGLFWPRRTFLRYPGTVVIEFLPPIDPCLDKRDFMLALQNAIEPATNALVARARAADPRLDQAVRNNKPATA